MGCRVQGIGQPDQERNYHLAWTANHPCRVTSAGHRRARLIAWRMQDHWERSAKGSECKRVTCVVQPVQIGDGREIPCGKARGKALHHPRLSLSKELGRKVKVPLQPYCDKPGCRARQTGVDQTRSSRKRDCEETQHLRVSL